MTKRRFDLQLVLPEAPNDDDCKVRLIDELRGRVGIDDVYIRTGTGGQASELCIDYDPAVLPLACIRKLVEGTGAALSYRYGHARWPVTGITDARKARTVAALLESLTGVLEAHVAVAGTIDVEYDRRQVSVADIMSTLASVRVMSAEPDRPDRSLDKASRRGAVQNEASDGDGHEPKDHDHGHGKLLGANTELIFALLCGLLLGVGFAIEKGVPSLSIGWPTGCYVAAYFFGGVYTLREALDNLRRKRFEIDTLMLVAAAGAAALGSWAEGALLLFLFSIGHALENYAMGRAKRAIEALAELAPEEAMVRRDGKMLLVPTRSLVIGDIVMVRPNERLPADGFVVDGTSSVNQAPVTGESIPVDKLPVADASLARARPDGIEGASRVFAGTINGSGGLEVEVTRTSGDSALARVVKMVSEAETRQSPTQRFTDRFQRIFVPAVLLLAFVLLFAWVVIDEPFRDSFYRAMAVLVAASPCALAIATPSAVLSGIARAARGGVLIKGGAPLEELGSLRAMAFDKTGTLTEGRPRITDVVAVNGVSEEELLSVAVAVESLSDHPLAAAIARDGRERLGDRELPHAQGLESLIGRGVQANIGPDTVWIGKAEMFGTGDIAPLDPAVQTVIAQLRAAGRTSMVVRRGARDLGAIGLLDTPRAGAREALQALRDLGIERMFMISGDHQKVADAIAQDVGLDKAIGDLMPEDKVEAIRRMGANAKIAMVGDGVNDAPAMAHATVGIAMGAVGSDVALETADVALMADDLRHLPFAVGLSRHTRRIIRQNVFVSLGIVAFLVPATIFGLGIGPAVAIHEGSTLLVVFNALRLLTYRPA